MFIHFLSDCDNNRFHANLVAQFVQSVAFTIELEEFKATTH